MVFDPFDLHVFFCWHLNRSLQLSLLLNFML